MPTPPLAEQDMRIFCDRFSKAYRALPAELAVAVLNDEVQHGGLLSRDTVRAAGAMVADAAR